MSTVELEVLSGPERRRRWTSAEKRRIVEESLAPNTTVVEVARRHDIHPNLLHIWRRQARASSAQPSPDTYSLRQVRTGPVTPTRQESDAPDNEVQFASVSVTPDKGVLAVPAGMIEIEFANGSRLRITGAVDVATVSAAISAVARGERHR
jgi:transposase